MLFPMGAVWVHSYLVLAAHFSRHFVDSAARVSFTRICGTSLIILYTLRVPRDAVYNICIPNRRSRGRLVLERMKLLARVQRTAYSGDQSCMLACYASSHHIHPTTYTVNGTESLRGNLLHAQEGKHSHIVLCS